MNRKDEVKQKTSAKLIYKHDIEKSSLAFIHWFVQIRR